MYNISNRFYLIIKQLKSVEHAYLNNSPELNEETKGKDDS